LKKITKPNKDQPPHLKKKIKKIIHHTEKGNMKSHKGNQKTKFAECSHRAKINKKCKLVKLVRRERRTPDSKVNHHTLNKKMITT